MCEEYTSGRADIDILYLLCVYRSFAVGTVGMVGLLLVSLAVRLAAKKNKKHSISEGQKQSSSVSESKKKATPVQSTATPQTAQGQEAIAPKKSSVKDTQSDNKPSNKTTKTQEPDKKRGKK